MTAVAARTSNNSSLPNPHTRMSSPRDVKRNILKNEETSGKESHVQNTQDVRPISSSRLDNAPAVQPLDSTTADPAKAQTSTANAAPSNGQPLGPPPRPGQNANPDQPDYFNQIHSQTQSNAYTGELNPFEAQFGNPSSETPGKLPGVASLTSPQSLLPGGTPGWGSLRSGPLSPAMLAGPTGTNDYFGEASFSRGFPTPNESSLRTGLTPGGGGSMFPAPSPNTQALFNALQPAGGATPGTLDFLRTVNRATAAAQGANFAAPTSQPTDPNLQPNMDQKYQNAQQQGTSDPFGHPDQDAAIGLYSLAQANGRMVPQSAIPANLGQMGNVGQHSQETSPISKRGAKNSIGSISAETGDLSDSGQSEDTKPATRSTRGKKSANSKASNSNRRKADDTPAKGSANKRTKGNSGSAMMDDIMDDEESSPKADDDLSKNRKMTDEEKRKNFLERNRVAALKCRQRKKQWLANLQAKVELFSTENDALSQTVTQLREEIVNLKSLLLAHRDCPVSAAQGIGGASMNMFLEGGHHNNPYGMAAPQPNGVPQGIPMMAQGPGGQMQRS